MNRKAFLLVALMLTAGAAAQAQPVTVVINKIDAKGVGETIGGLTLEDSAQGLKVHANASCAPADQNGQPVAGLGAGGHFDPAATAKHLGPAGDGHKGDMPVLVVAPDGTATSPAVSPHLKVADVKGHAIVIHAGGDNYSDQPAPLGGGGARIACGVVK